MKNAYEMNQRINTINRSLGQLRRYFIWNLDRITVLEREREDISRELPAIEESERLARELIWGTA